MSDTSPKMLSHYVGNWLVKGRFELAKGRPEQADAVRQDLLTKLKGLQADDAVTSCINYLSEHPWRTPDDTDAFQRHYDQADPSSAEMDRVLRELGQKR